MSLLYLEVDDEITGAIARIRAVKDGEAIVVVPVGSRIATSRINFKLLVREGNERRLNIVAVSDEPSARALAISAGLPAYDSIAAAQQALTTFREQDRRLAERIGKQPADPVTQVSVDRGRERSPLALEQTQVLPAMAGHSGKAGSTALPARRPVADAGARDEGRRARRVGRTPIIAATVLLLLLAGVGYGAYQFLPTASITLQPATTQLSIGPFTVIADPGVAVADIEAGIVPAQLIEIPLTVTDQFTATGVEVRETRAEGSVRFRSENTLNDVPVLEGTVVSTSGGVDFETTSAAVVPRADFATSTPGTVDVPVRATRAGPRGNVAADAITEVSSGLRGQLVSVRNPDPTDGGRRVEESVVTEADFNAALEVLDDHLHVALAEAMEVPGNTPRGLTLYPRTAQTGSPEPSPSAPEIVGTPQTSFTVAFESVATVLAVDETLVDELAATRLRGMLGADQRILGDQVASTHSATSVIGATIPYEVSAAATVYAVPDTVTLTASVRGKSIPDAQQILAPYGMVEIAMWPEFVDRLPDQTARISLVLVSPSPRP